MWQDAPVRGRRAQVGHVLDGGDWVISTLALAAGPQEDPREKWDVPHCETYWHKRTKLRQVERRAARNSHEGQFMVMLV